MARLMTELAAGFEAPRIKTPLQARAEQLKIRGAENDLELDRQTIAANEQKLAEGKLKQDETQRKQEGVAKLSELMAAHRGEGGKVDHDAIMKGLAAAGYGDTALAYDTTRRADEASAITNELNQMKAAKEKGGAIASIINAAITKRTPEAADQAIGSLIAGGFIKAAEGSQMLGMPKDDAFWAMAEQKRDEQVEFDKQMDAYYKAREEAHKALLRPLEIEGKQLANTKATQETTGTVPLQEKDKQQLAMDDKRLTQQAREGELNRGVTMRGQNMTDARGRELAEATRDAKPPTGAERRVFSYYERAKDAADTLATLEGQMADKGLLAQGVFKYAPNFLQSDDNQVYRQAQRQFTEARLRKDSGAAISKSEYENDERTFFPVPGDTKQTLERKAKARATLLDSLARESGKAAKEAGVGVGGGGPQKGAIEDGYVFLGGDPADKKNWKKQ